VNWSDPSNWTKLCLGCRQQLPLASFRQKPGRDGLWDVEPRCRECHAREAREWRARNPEKVNDRHRGSRRACEEPWGPALAARFLARPDRLVAFAVC